MIDEAIIERCVGREETRRDVADSERFLRLAALLNRDWTPSAGAPPLGHFVLFRSDQRQSRIGDDGHPVRDTDGMLPAVELPRRMWAGSRITFEKPLEPGVALMRRSRLKSAAPKSGRSGHLVFCTVEHEIRCEHAHDVYIREEQDIVYREAHKGLNVVARPEIRPEFAPQQSTVIRVDSVMLFRYSALTFNAHRIHYDRDYARDAEGYPGLVVHGPYLATLLFDYLEDTVKGRRVAEFRFRAVSPAFDGEELMLGVSFEEDEAFLSVVSPAGLAMQAKARLG